MEPLVTTKRVLIRLDMYPADDDDKTSIKWKIFSRIIIASFFMHSLIGLIGTLTASYRLMSIDLQQSLLALISVTAIFNIAYNIVASLFLRNKTKRIFTQLSAIYGASKCIKLSVVSVQVFSLNFILFYFFILI